jgi:phosphoribosylamine---glycine ligase
MERDGRSFKGALRADLILLEFNVRLGDPEAQVLIMRLMSDLLPALITARERVFESVDLRWHAEHAVCVVMAVRGIPVNPSAAPRSAISPPHWRDVWFFYGDPRRTGLKRALASNGVGEAVKRPEPEIPNPATRGRNEALHVR